MWVTSGCLHDTFPDCYRAWFVSEAMLRLAHARNCTSFLVPPPSAFTVLFKFPLCFGVCVCVCVCVCMCVCVCVHLYYGVV
jgi:hypothetical protein